MDRLTPQLPSGIASFCQQYPPANWRQFSNIFLETEESLVDYAKFCSSVMDIYSSLVMSIASENEISFGWICGEDLNYFKRYYFNAHVLSSGPMQHDTRLVDIIHGGFEGLSMPKGTRLDHLLRYTSYLRELHYIHKNYACRKILAKCDFIKWDSDFDDIFQRLKSEKKWSEFSDSSLKTALIEHFSLLHKLNDNLDISVGNMSEGDSILEAITKDYSEELSRLTKGIAETRMKNYVDHLEFKRLVNKCAAQAKALSTEFIAKGQAPGQIHKPITVSQEKSKPSPSEVCEEQQRFWRVSPRVSRTRPVFAFCYVFTFCHVGEDFVYIYT
ncbi:hypothetical protein CsSME_00024685 [Camellia sinensis var. sinensis]